MDASAAEIFPHVRIVMGMVVGLGITRILTGFAGLIQHPARARLSLTHLLWAFSILIELVLFWWWEFALFSLPSWSFGVFAFVIVYAVALYLLAALLFPDRIEDYAGYEDFFLKRRYWFFGVFALTFLLDFIDTVIKGAPHLNNLGFWYLAQAPIGIGIAMIAIWMTSRRFHLAIVLLHLFSQAAWIVRLFGLAR